MRWLAPTSSPRLRYLHQTGALAPIAQWLTGNENIGRPRDGNANGDRGNAGANANDGDEFNRPVVMPTTRGAARPGNGMPRSYLGEVKIFMYSLVASIFPSWIPPRLRAAQGGGARRGKTSIRTERSVRQTLFSNQLNI